MASWRRPRRVLFASAAAATVSACAYAGYKLWQRRQELSLLYRTVSSMLAAPKSRLQVHFEETQADCDIAVAGLAPTLRARLTQLSAADRLHAELRTVRDRARKLELWAELKVASIARTLSAVYALVYTNLLMRVLANLVARHLLLERTAAAADGAQHEAPGGAAAAADPLGAAAARLDASLNGNGSCTESARAPAPPPSARVPTSAQLRVLEASEHLVQGAGLSELHGAVERGVGESFGDVALTRALTPRELEALLRRVRAPLERGVAAHALLRRVLLPAEVAPAARASGGDGGSLGRADAAQACAAGAPVAALLLREVREVVDSAPFRLVLDQMLDAAFAELSRELNERIAPPAREARASAAEPAAAAAAAAAAALPLAKIVPLVSNCFGSVLADPRAGADAAHGAPPAGRYLRAASGVPSLPELCLMAYAPQAAAEPEAAEACAALVAGLGLGLGAGAQPEHAAGTGAFEAAATAGTLLAEADACHE